MKSSTSSKPFSFTAFLQNFEIVTAIKQATADVDSHPEARRMVEAGIARADAKRRTDESAFEIVRPAGFPPLACVSNRWGHRFCVPADVLADYIISQRATRHSPKKYQEQNDA